MGSKTSKLKVELTDQATASLEEIWDLNATQYGRSHADEYIQFLRHKANQLATDFQQYSFVPQRTSLRFVVIKKSNLSGAYGHIAVYRVTEELVEVIDFFHTSQNWQGKLKELP